MKGHKQRLLDYLKNNGSITTLEAIQELGNTRLSEYIRQLRADGYIIKNEHQKGKNRYGEKVNFDKFVLVKMIEDNMEHIPRID